MRFAAVLLLSACAPLPQQHSCLWGGSSVYEDLACACQHWGPDGMRQAEDFYASQGKFKRGDPAPECK